MSSPTQDTPPIAAAVRIGHVHLKVADLERSLALYLRDPDGNGIELYWDRPEVEWPRTTGGGLAMFTKHLDLGRLLAEAPPDGPSPTHLR